MRYATHPFPAVRRRLLAAGLTAATVSAGGVAVAVLASADAERTAQGSTVGGVPASDLSLDRLRTLVKDRVASSPASVRITLGSRTLSLRVADLGIGVDEEATAREVLATSPARRRFGILGQAPGKAVSPQLVKDDDRLQQVAARLLRQATILESHGSLTYADGRITSTPPRPGQTTTTEAIAEALETYVANLARPATLTVPTTMIPAHVTAAQVQALADRAQAQVERPTLLASGSLTTTISGATLGQRLTIVASGSGDGHPIALGLDGEGQALAQRVAEDLSTKAVEPKIAAPLPTAVLTAQGNVTWRTQPAVTSVTAKGSAGQQVTAQAVAAALLAELQRDLPVARLEVPNVVVPPSTSDAQATKVNALLGTFTTPFTCCPSRVTNIRLISKTIDGTVIGPGQSFSLNGIVGKRTKEKGYVEAPFILDGELSKDIGGGVSQYATTALNAAFFAGLRLDQHQAHSFYISRYPPGREATVNFPGIDLRWTNTTSAPVVVRSMTGQNSLTVALYGQGDGREVEAITGRRRPIAGRDFRITVTRVVRIPGQPAQKDSFTTAYNKEPEH